MRSVTAALFGSFDELPLDQLVGDFAGQIAHIFFGEEHAGSNRVRKTFSLTHRFGVHSAAADALRDRRFAACTRVISARIGV